LKGENIIFIEKNLNWEERKVQNKINLWAREQREKLEMKVGLEKIRVKRECGKDR